MVFARLERVTLFDFRHPPPTACAAKVMARHDGSAKKAIICKLLSSGSLSELLLHAHGSRQICRLICA